ncbi:MAG: hypothetical protein ACW99U_21430 [Candidatus Thorarchaeota archaeon]|jgi:hypothetical protein
MKKLFGLLSYVTGIWAVWCAIVVVMNLFNLAYDINGVGGAIVTVFFLPIAWLYWLVKVFINVGFVNNYTLSNLELFIALGLTFTLMHLREE